MHAAKANHLAIVDQLFQKSNIGINATSRSGHTVLMAAVIDNHLQIVSGLLQHPDIDVSMTNDNAKKL